MQDLRSCVAIGYDGTVRCCGDVRVCSGVFVAPLQHPEIFPAKSVSFVRLMVAVVQKHKKCSSDSLKTCDRWKKHRNDILTDCQSKSEKPRSGCCANHICTCKEINWLEFRKLNRKTSNKLLSYRNWLRVCQLSILPSISSGIGTQNNNIQTNNSGVAARVKEFDRNPSRSLALKSSQMPLKSRLITQKFTRLSPL